jgi:hypothetical protein
VTIFMDAEHRPAHGRFFTSMPRETRSGALTRGETRKISYTTPEDAILGQGQARSGGERRAGAMFRREADLPIGCGCVT